jgi:predicted anti-sigma-YlaC factor YlaD
LEPFIGSLGVFGRTPVYSGTLAGYNQSQQFRPVFPPDDLYHIGPKVKRLHEPWQRLVIGGLSLICLGLAAILLVFNPGSGTGLIGLLVRIGLVLGTIWLAMPQLLKLRPLQSATVWVVLLGLLLVAARSPNLFRVAIIMMAAGGLIHFFLKSASRLAAQGADPNGKGKPKHK